jgi:hypothetical protein
MYPDSEVFIWIDNGNSYGGGASIVRRRELTDALLRILAILKCWKRVIYVTSDIETKLVDRWRGSFSHDDAEMLYFRTFRPLIASSTHVRMVSGAFFYPGLVPFFHPREGDIHMGTDWPDGRSKLIAAYAYWASALQLLCAYATACARSFTRAESPGFAITIEGHGKRCRASLTSMTKQAVRDDELSASTDAETGEKRLFVPHRPVSGASPATGAGG